MTNTAMTEPVEFDTPRLRLRQWREDDYAPFAVLNADPRVMAFFPSPLGRAESDAMADRCRTLIAERGWGLWAVEDKRDRRFIGFVGLHVPIVILPFSPCVEIGWRLAFSTWGNGFATEAARQTLRYGFEDLDLSEIVAFTTVANARSRAVMQRLGMSLMPDTFEHPALSADSPLLEHCLYRLSRGKWRIESATQGR